MESKFFIGKNEIITFSSIKLADKMFFYNKDFEDEMINYIKSQNTEKAMSALDKLTSELMNNSDSMEYIKYVCFQVINNIICGLQSIGVEPSDTDMSNKYIFGKIKNAETNQDLKSFTTRYIKKSISLVKELKEKRHSALINKTIDFINNNYQDDLSLDKISEVIFLSPRYLNTIFKSEMGMTIFDYITDLRMEKAKELIVNYNKKIQDVAYEVGYNSVQSFLRLFKKYYKMTPVEFRRNYTG